MTDALNEEIEAWKLYGNVLSQPNRDQFFRMLSEVEKYQTADNHPVTESLFMALIIQQQKTITELLEKLASMNQT
jgi:hypothetical protein